MNRLFLTLLLSLFAASVPAAALALDYRSLAEATTMYDAPSLKSTPMFVIARQTPVEVVVALQAWVKVRDAGGDLAWVERHTLSDKRTVQVRVALAQIRNAPQADAALVFEAEKDVVLELVEIPPGVGWIKVQHRDGQSGYLHASQVWGL